LEASLFKELSIEDKKEGVKRMWELMAIPALTGAVALWLGRNTSSEEHRVVQQTFEHYNIHVKEGKDKTNQADLSHTFSFRRKNSENVTTGFIGHFRSRSERIVQKVAHH
jgi:hypothetical protein